MRFGLFDGATVELDKLFAPAAAGLDTSLGVLVWFRGKVADAEIGRSVVRLKVKGVLDRLSTTQFPRRLYASSCSHVFGAPMCGYDRVAGANALGEPTGWGAVTIAALAGSTPSVIISSYVPAVMPSPYNEGTITALTGGNAGIARTIRYHEAGYVYAAQPFLVPIAAGDTFVILPGCSHSASMCEEVFNNLGAVWRISSTCRSPRGQFDQSMTVSSSRRVIAEARELDAHAVSPRRAGQGRRGRLPDVSCRVL